MTKEQYLTGHMPYEGGEVTDETYICPMCGAEEPDKFYVDDNGDCVGCTECLRESDNPYGEV